MSTTPNCEVCGLPMIPIVYGLPDPEAMKEAEEGKISLGGCIVEFDDPQYTCLFCQKD